MTNSTQSLIDQLVDDLEPVSPLRFGRGALLALGGLVLAMVLVAIFATLRVDVVSGQPAGIFMLSSGLFLMLALACGAAVLMMCNPRVGSPHGGGIWGWGWALAMAGLLPLSALALILVEGQAAWLASEPDHGSYCFSYSAGLGLLTGAALVLWLRRGAPTSPERAGLLTGIAAGAAGVFAFSFACPLNSIAHIGLWHGLPVVFSAFAGRVMVPHLVRW